MNITNETKVVANIAKKQTKLGAHMHNRAYASLGLNFVYIPFTVTDCKNAISGLRAFRFRGSAVSMPYKSEVISYLDKLDPIAKAIGAVNTISNDNGVLTGYNSDWVGATESLKAVTSLNGKTVALLGAGGVGRAIAYGLKQHNARVVIFNRNRDKAKKLSQQFHLTFGGSIEDLADLREYDILINATSVGFGADSQESIVDEDLLKEEKVVMDVVFDRIHTPFIKLAERKGCKIIPGYKMVVNQAAFQFELFTNRKAPLQIMEKAILELL